MTTAREIVEVFDDDSEADRFTWGSKDDVLIIWPDGQGPSSETE